MAYPGINRQQEASIMIPLSMDLVRVTEAAAVAASAWVGTGAKELADKAATDAMRDRLNRIHFAARIVIGEGKKDDSFGLFSGEMVGRWKDEAPPGSPVYELCVDPIEGTRPTVQSGPEAISVLGAAEGAGSLMETEDFYTLKLAYGPEIASQVELTVDEPLEQIVRKAAKALGKPVDRLFVCILDRPRHRDMIEELRRLRVRIKLIQDCDVSGALATCREESGVDLMYGVGGAPEAVIAACGIKCLGGRIQAQRATNEGRSQPGTPIIDTEDLVRGDCVFAATGITNGSLLHGVRFTGRGAVTNSVFLRSRSGTVRWLVTEHGQLSRELEPGIPMEGPI
jgi:fructose-1,6-bisphosphatase II